MRIYCHIIAIVCFVAKAQSLERRKRERKIRRCRRDEGPTVAQTARSERVDTYRETWSGGECAASVRPAFHVALKDLDDLHPPLYSFHSLCTTLEVSVQEISSVFVIISRRKAGSRRASSLRRLTFANADRGRPQETRTISLSGECDAR